MTVAPTKIDLTGASANGAAYSWALTNANPNGDAVPVGGTSLSLTYHILGTFGSATVVLKGSIDGTNYFTLKDMDGNDVSVTAAASGSIRDLPLAPTSSGGSGQTTTVLLFAK